MESAYRDRPSAVAAALAWIQDWLLEPLPERAGGASLELPPRPVVAVVGLRPGCGASTVARALAARLAASDPCGCAIVAGSLVRAPLAPAARSTGRLRLALRTAGRGAVALGRLCLAEPLELPALVELARGQAPLLLDAGRGEPAREAAELADLTLVVAPADAEPALAELLAGSLGRAAVVVNQAREPGRWVGRAAALLPGSRLGARLSAAGWEAPGALGRDIAGLARVCEAACA